MTGDTALVVVSSCLIVSQISDYFLRRRIWRAIAELRGDCGSSKPVTKEEARRSGERHVVRPGSTPEVRTIDDSGERVRPGRPI